MSEPRQSLELVLDRQGEDAVRAVWQRLADAGLPSLLDHRSSSNRPHVTVVTSAVVTPEQDERLAVVVAGRLPIRTAWGAVTTFGDGPYAVVRLVRASPALLSLHRDLAAVLDLPEDDLTAPARWTPHVSLAMRVPADHRDAVLDCVADVDGVADLEARPEHEHESEAVLTWVSARRWDPVARREWSL